MNPIVVSVYQRIASAPMAAAIVSNNSDYTVKFEFDAEWNDREPKFARFICGDWSSDACITNNTARIPVVPGSFSTILVGAYAGELVTTTPAVIRVASSILAPTLSPMDAAEAERVRAEAERRHNELERIANENGRKNAEIAREAVKAEMERSIAGANAATNAANTAAQAATDAAEEVQGAIDAANEAIERANDATEGVEAAIDAATNAASEATTAADDANTKATLAEQAASDASNAADDANTKATLAGQAASDATISFLISDLLYPRLPLLTNGLLSITLRSFIRLQQASNTI